MNKQQDSISEEQDVLVKALKDLRKVLEFPKDPVKELETLSKAKELMRLQYHQELQELLEAGFSLEITAKKTQTLSLFYVFGYRMLEDMAQETQNKLLK